MIYVSALLTARRNLTVITDPLFYLLAIPAVTFLGLSKGGFAGLGMLATPLLALIVPPLEAAAILLPILIVQDAISVWTYHRAWSAWNLKVLLPGSIFGVGGGWLFATLFLQRRDRDHRRHDRAHVRPLCMDRRAAARLSGASAAASRDRRSRPWVCSGAPCPPSLRR